MKALRILCGVVLMCCISIIGAGAGCTTTQISDTKAAALKGFNALCTAEPTVYAAIGAWDVIHPLSFSQRNKATAVHAGVTELCTNRPTDLISGLVTLTSLYSQVVSILHQANPQAKET